MKDVYKRLAEHLDDLPAGFPATDSGVELRILKRLFTPCPGEAIMLKRKEDADQYVQPENTIKTYLKMAKERGK